MSLITLETTFTKNASLQVGDTIYYLDEGEDLIRKIGVVQQILDNGIVCDTDSASQLGPLSSTSYIFFGKDKTKNTSGVIGYYAEVNLSNSERTQAELFAVNTEIFISSN